MTTRTPSKNRGPFLAFNQQFFDKHQKTLIWLLNHWLTRRWFRWILRIRKHDVGYNRPIVRLLPHAYVVPGDKPGRFTADFRTHPKYGKRIYHAFKYVWWVMHAWDWMLADRLAPALSFGFDTLTAYPDPHTESTSVDGSVAQGYGAGAGVVWSTLVAAAGGGSASANDDAGENFAIRFLADNVTDRWRFLTRSIFLFDTSALTAGATITAAVMSLFGSAKSDTLSATPDIDIYTSTPASDTALVNGDYAQLGTTSQTGSPITYANWSIVAYNDFTFDATGRGNISKTGVSKFGARNANYDVANSAPTWGSGGTASLRSYQADNPATTNDPKLVITYTTAVDVTVNATTQLLTASLPIASVSGAATLSPSVLSAAFSIAEATFTNATNVIISAAAQILTCTLPAASFQTQQVLSASVQVITVSLQTATASVSAVISVAVQTLTATLNSITLRLNGWLDQWNDKYTARGTSHGDKYSSRGSSFNNKYSNRGTSFDDKYQQQ